MNSKKTVVDIINMKSNSQLITMLTAYDASFARLLENSGIDMLLVGDSLGMVVLGYESTVPVSMDEMIHHAKAVRRGAPNSLVVGDMPFLSYHLSVEDSIANAGRFMKEGGCDAVKLEGGHEVCDKVKAIVRAGIPVMGHIGLTPQTAGSLGGYKVQGKDLETARKLLTDARALTDAGVFAIVMECVPDKLSEAISSEIKVPTIGIGAGKGCDGQVLVTHDLLGMFEKFVPKFVKTYVHLAPQIKEAVDLYKEEVRLRTFPEDKHGFSVDFDIDELLR